VQEYLFAYRQNTHSQQIHNTCRKKPTCVKLKTVIFQLPLCFHCVHYTITCFAVGACQWRPKSRASGGTDKPRHAPGQLHYDGECCKYTYLEGASNRTIFTFQWAVPTLPSVLFKLKKVNEQHRVMMQTFHVKIPSL
jgi:hypothetical protein